MSLGAWLALAFAGLWIGTMLGLLSGFWASLELIATLIVLLVVLLVLGLMFHSRVLTVASGLGLLAVGGLAVATAIAPSVAWVRGATCFA